MTTIVDGRALANTLMAELQKTVTALAQQGVIPQLRIVQVGDDPASNIYIRNKLRRAEKLGIDAQVVHLSATISQADFMHVLARLNADPTVDAYMVQEPLPPQIDQSAVVAAIDPQKDADGFTPVNFGHLWQGDPGPVPATPAGIMAILDRYEVPIQGKRAVVIGRSKIVGRPLAAMLLNRDATVTMAHSKTVNLPAVTREADILIAAVGVPHFVTADMVKTGAVVIDVGINRTAEGKVTGDVDFAAVAPKTALITPVPRGVGPMTVAMLMQQTVNLAKERVGHE
ncbi:bifunctional 5,10-methylenetetrahydrofolate dehydrogenase/5,10-methenyltetrahydrofolate cyclohydrolase [Schleiferilactobacillus perolens]|jgi:methylenetetrahydrofolate dehydrogenase (NADP+)/methenyltetrahydrofolate cyclohydrolase|nr:tetrahydrofolate dehydrogenase/cyclohydrolase catalytic domain-containing protein [Schleiferilactobacillus perolens]MCI2172481.1 bifunctional 5,10-methylene-tetrahydrofolate dehydrogenase/5,10-methylene-tetrahydrofolate cyclohydrolase [Schleiferilactobacillus perolens]